MTGLRLLVGRSLRQHLLSTAVTITAIALAAGLVMAVFLINAQAFEAFTAGDMGFDGVMGGRGSKVQLVLNSVFHMEASPGNIPWRLYEDIKKQRRLARVAVPLATGDNYRGFRIVGTTEEFFREAQPRPGKKLRVQKGHQIFNSNHKEAVIGSYVATETGLRRGATFSPYHGLRFREGTQHADVYTVVGVLDATNTPADHVIWIPIEGIFRMGGHMFIDESGETHQADGKSIPDEAREISGVLLKVNGFNAGLQLDEMINRRGKVATFAYPVGSIVGDIFHKLGWIIRVLEMVAYLVVVVAVGSILASIYNTMNERRREFAILRALGANRRTVFTAIVAEAGTIAALGATAGYLVCAAIMMGGAYVVRIRTGVVLDVWVYHPVYVIAPTAIVFVGALAGILPARKAYATDVAENLVPHS